MRLPVCLALLSLAGCAPPTPPLGNVTLPIINGTPDNGDPAVMLLIASVRGTDRVGLCTSTLISPHLLLTAAHCVDAKVLQGDMGPPPPLDFYVSTSSSVDFSKPIDQSTLLQVATTDCDDSFNPSPAVFVSNGHDVGAVVLAAAQTIPTVPYNKTALPASLVGESVRIIGYGVDSGSDTTGKSAGTKRQATTTVTNVSSLYVELGDGTHGICEGDSGGPALAMMNGVETIVGITAFGQNGCPTNVPSDDTRIDTYGSEIDNWVALAESGAMGSQCSLLDGGAVSSGGGSGGSGGGGSGGSGGGSSGCSIGGATSPESLAVVLVLFAVAAIFRGRAARAASRRPRA
jgi:hypothetical protein